jgi:hypothetical protein
MHPAITNAIPVIVVFHWNLLVRLLAWEITRIDAKSPRLRPWKKINMTTARQ